MADVVTTTNNAGVTSAGAYRNICEKYASENSEVNPVEKTTCNSLSTRRLTFLALFASSPES